MRVIAGRLGGRTLVAPSGVATRPTSDRVREALFSILGDVSGQAVADLYAGTGALGIEALSRGAAHVVFVESSGPALRALRRNLSSLALEQSALVLPMRVERAVSASAFSGRRFDLVLIDPPYAEARSGGLARALAPPSGAPLASLLHDGAKVMVEHASADEPPKIPGLELERTRTYGDTSLSFYVV